MYLLILKQNAGQLNIRTTNRVLEFIKYTLNSCTKIVLTAVRCSNGTGATATDGRISG
jgi:hypothetical protein